MGVSNHVYFSKNEIQENTRSHGIKESKTTVKRGKVNENFIQAVRSRKEEDLDAHVFEGRFRGLRHLANISID